MCGINMGETAEVLAKEFQISRGIQDEFALSSHHKTARAATEGFFKDEIAPVILPHDPQTVVEADVGPEPTKPWKPFKSSSPFSIKNLEASQLATASP
jgi:acetyl-CoA acetyltransferase